MDEKLPTLYFWFALPAASLYFADETTEGTPQRQLDSNSSSSSDSIASSISNIYIDEANGDPTALPTTISGYTFVSVLIDLLDDEVTTGSPIF